jgi:hypothetical protein
MSVDEALTSDASASYQGCLTARRGLPPCGAAGGCVPTVPRRLAIGARDGPHEIAIVSRWQRRTDSSVRDNDRRILRRVSGRSRVVWVMVAALAFGSVAAVVKGPNGGADFLSRLRTDIGNVSVPWLAVPFIAGAQTRSGPAAFFVGLATTLLALAAFYAVTSVFVDLGGSTPLSNLARELNANRIYLAAGLLVGPPVGVLGAWWSARRWPPVLILIGVLLIGEPIALTALGLVLSADRSTMIVVATEFVAGVVALAVGSLRTRRGHV